MSGSVEAPLESETLEPFRSAVARREEEVDLVEVALLLAQTECPLLACSLYRRRLDPMGEEAGAPLAARSPNASPRSTG
jgi:hypothetical protein